MFQLLKYLQPNFVKIQKNVQSLYEVQYIMSIVDWDLLPHINIYGVKYFVLVSYN
jgi:hypothetical protein